MKRTERAEVRLNEVEKRALESLAELNARTESEQVRALIRTEAQRQGIWNPNPNKEVNQMYKNLEMSTDTMAQIDAEIDRLKAELRKVDAEIDRVDPYADGPYSDDQAHNELLINLKARGDKLEARIEELRRILRSQSCDAPYVGAV